MSVHRAQPVPPGERILVDTRPGVPSIILRPLLTVLVMVGLGAAAAWVFDYMAGLVGRGDQDLSRTLHRFSAWAGLCGVAFAALRLLWEVLFWWSCRFVLTEERAYRAFGVFSRSVSDMPLRNVQHLTVYRSLLERLCGLGTVGIRTAGGAFPEIYWWMVDRPGEVLAAVRRAVDAVPEPEKRAAADALAPGPVVDAREAFTAPERPMLIGLVGGIGSGKSAVAAEFGRLGALVIDSDKEARAALDTPPVREELVKWWGTQILTPEGRIDRSKVASIVFGDPAERARLEGLVHPLVKSTRARIVERAASEGKRLVVMDAPLLFEAGVDRECDAVVFVEAPEPLRLARVQASRGWDAAELARREKAQLPLEAKRERADDVVVNDASREVLAGRVRDLLERIQRRGSLRENGGRERDQTSAAASSVSQALP